MVERKLFTIFFNHLALMEQGSQYVGCGRFSVLHASLNCLFSLLTFSGSSASKQEHLLSQTEFRAGRIPT